MGTARKHLIHLADLSTPSTPASDFIGVSDPVESHGNLPSSLLHPHLLMLVILRVLDDAQAHEQRKAGYGLGMKTEDFKGQHKCQRIAQRSERVSSRGSRGAQGEL